MKHWVASVSLILTCFNSFAQDIAVGTWRTHFSYSNARIIEITPDKIFCAVENGLFSREISSGEVRRLSKIDGLADTGISTMKYDELNRVLVIGYESGFVDFIYEDRILTVSEVANTNLDDSKTINDIAFSDSQTFLATDLGIIVVNTSNAVISENFVQIGTEGSAVDVLEITTLDDSLIVRTNQGIQSGNLSSNLLDFNSWNQYLLTSSFRSLTRVESVIYALDSNNLMRLTGGNWEDTGIDLPIGADKLFRIGSELYTATNDGFVYQLSSNDFVNVIQVAAQSINDLDFVGTTLLIADGNIGLTDEEGNLLSPSGPLSDNFSNFRVVSNDVFGFHAPSPFGYDGSENQPNFSVFSEGSWEIQSIEGFGNVSDAVSFNGNLYYSSIGKGIYNESSSQIERLGIEGVDSVIVNIAAGESLWVSSFGSNNPIYLLNRDDQWTSLTSTELFDNQFLTIDLSQIEVAWLGSASGSISVFNKDENTTELINSSDGVPSSFTDIEITVEDNAWISTLRGPALFPSASFVSSDQSAIRPTFENRVLFEDEQVNAIITDGGNNVWFGTEN
ncbi:MAG: hypothetical protein AAFY41_02990, partial [Bacteroidota bacterium]